MQSLSIAWCSFPKNFFNQSWAFGACGSAVWLKKLLPGHSRYKNYLPLGRPYKNNLAYPKSKSLNGSAKNGIFY